MRASSPGRSWGWCWVGGRADGRCSLTWYRAFGGRSVPRAQGPGDVCGADPVAVGDRGQPLDVGAHEPADHRGLGLAQLGELGRDVRHRAVVLAQLPAAGDRRGRGSVALGGERHGQCLGPVDRLPAGRPRRSRPRSTPGSRGRPAAARRRPGRRPGRRRPHVPQGGQRQVVVACGKEERPASVRWNRRAGRPRPRCGRSHPAPFAPRANRRPRGRPGAGGRRRARCPAASRARWRSAARAPAAGR